MILTFLTSYLINAQERVEKNQRSEKYSVIAEGGNLFPAA
jgi:hypothetical protein